MLIQVWWTHELQGEPVAQPVNGAGIGGGSVGAGGAIPPINISISTTPSRTSTTISSVDSNFTDGNGSQYQ